MSRTTVFVDVSDLLRHGARTGIQRVVGQVLPRLAAAADDELELRMLRFDPVEHHYLELDTTSMLAVLAGATDEPEVTGRRDIGGFGPNDVFLDLDSAWNSPLKRSTLYPRLKDAGATIVSYVYDLVPLQVPEVVHETTSANWVVHLSAVLTWSDLATTDRRSAERDLLASRSSSTCACTSRPWSPGSGATFRRCCAVADELACSSRWRAGGPALRGHDRATKKDLVALGAFDELAEQYPDVHLSSLVARAGSRTTPWPRHRAPSYGSGALDPGTERRPLAELYRSATTCLYLSRDEGYGLPIAEALVHGGLTVASDGSGMPEVGGDSRDYVWHTSSPRSWRRSPSTSATLTCSTRANRTSARASGRCRWTR